MSARPANGLGIVTGLVAEAGCLRRALQDWTGAETPRIFCSGCSAARAAEGAARLIADGVGGLLSFGIAGGLDPALEPGSLVLADVVITPDGQRIGTDSGGRDRFHAAGRNGLRFTIAPITGRDRPVVSAEAKRALYAETGAAAVDMESHAVAKAAVAAGLPFVVLRAVADPAGRTLPDCALAGVDADGRTRALPVLGKLVLKPWQLPALVRLGRDTAAALAALSGVADLGATLFRPL